MAESQLKTVIGSGTQAATQSPQSASGQTDSAASQAKSVQPGTATNVLTTDNGGIKLEATPLTTVSLNTAAQTLQPATPAATPPRHFNPILFGVSIILCLIAVAMFWVTNRSAKNTTNYS